MDKFIVRLAPGEAWPSAPPSADVLRGGRSGVPARSLRRRSASIRTTSLLAAPRGVRLSCTDS